MALDSRLLQQIRHLVRGGFVNRNRAVEIICEELYAPGELPADEVATAVDLAFKELEREAADWPAVTDCDRLDTAFAALLARGIVALQNTGYTQSDGHADVMGFSERHSAQAEFSGYCFYHGQDLERAVDGGGLHLSFGPIDPSKERSTGPAVGQAIVEELNRAGLRTEWNGTFDQRIFIPTFDWKYRRGQGVVAEIAPGVREAMAGGDKLCATFEITGDESRWVQFVGSVVNAAYPLAADPDALIARLGNAVVESSEPGKYVTVRLQITSALAIAKWIDGYFRHALGSGSEYSIDLSLQWI
jgi:hypothetical protein